MNVSGRILWPRAMDRGRSLDGRGRAPRFRKSVSVTAFGGAWALVFSGNPVEVRRMMSRSVLGQSVKAWWRQLSLGVLLIAVGYVALFLALVVVPAQAQLRGRLWVESQQGRVGLTPDYRVEGGWYVASGCCPLPTLLVNTVGIDLFASVKHVELDCEEIYTLTGLRDFSRMEHLSLNQFVHDVSVFDALRGLPRLKTVTLSKWTGLTAQETDRISRSLSGVKVVSE
jgi:hypothetical protein